ncbi:MAG: STAS domain-containing protein [bacterium]
MKFKDIVEGDLVIVNLYGKILGGQETAICHSRVHEHLNSGRKHFVMDMGNVEWTNSQGLGMLIGCYVSIKKAGGRVVLARMDNVKKLLTMTRLIQVFDCYDSVEEAKQALIERSPN